MDDNPLRKADAYRRRHPPRLSVGAESPGESRNPLFPVSFARFIGHANSSSIQSKVHGK
jgi:hypothetical protein